MRQLSSLILSLLLCTTCLAQPDSRPGPYQATLAKINALLVGGAATVKEIEFTVDGSALASSSKTQAYSDGNAGSLFVRVPTAKQIQGLVNSSILLNLGRAGNTLSDTNWAIGKYGTGAAYDGTAPGIAGVGSSLYYNIPTGGAHLFFAANGSNLLQVTESFVRFFCPAGTEQGRFDTGGLSLYKNLYWSGAGSASSTLTTEWADAANGNKFANVPTGKYEQHRYAGTPYMSLGNGAIFTWALGPWGSGASLSSATTGLGSDGSNNYHNVATTSNYHTLGFGGAYKYRFSNALCEFDRLSLGGSIGSSTDPGAGGLALTGKLIIPTSSPASNGTGTTGQIAWDANYIYVCTATNTWKRAALTGGY